MVELITAAAPLIVMFLILFPALVPYLVAVTRYLRKQCEEGRAVLTDTFRVPSSAGGHGGRNILSRG